MLTEEVKDVELERTILGSALVYDEALEDIAYSLSEEDFHSEQHRDIFRELLTCSVKGYTPDPLLIAGRLKNDRYDAHTYISELMTTVDTSKNIKPRLNKLRDVSQCRQLVTKAMKVISASNNIEDHADWIKKMRA